MKLVMTLLVRNEAEMIEANLDYHLAQGVDFVIVTDHDSTDETADLLRRYEQAGVVEVLREGGPEYHQSVRVTRMARLALSRYAADWIIHNDADEFWWPLSGSLRDVFASIPASYGQIEVQRRNFLPRPDGRGPFHSRLLYRQRQSLNPSGVRLEPKVAHRAHPDVVVPPGNHAISGAELTPAPADELIEIFHFPMRSYEQFEHKVIQTGIGYEKLDHRSPGVGQDQLKLLQIYREDGLRQYYDDALLDDEALGLALKQDSIVLDRRLSDFMQTLSRGPLRADRPDGPATRSFIAKALGAYVRLDSIRVQMTDLEQEDAAHQAELAAAGEAIQSLVDSQDEAQAQRAALEQHVRSLLDGENETRAQSANLEQQLEALEQQLEARQTELATTSQELQTQLNSRLVRWSSSPRRCWYWIQSRLKRLR
jgi:hypothetical protein